MFLKFASSAVLAGIATGLIAAALQLFFVVPVIQEAELYETGALVHFGGASDHTDHVHDDAHDHSAATDEDESGFRRHALTFLATVTVYTGYAFVLVAGFGLASRWGHTVSARSGLIWGLAGFLAAHLLPAAGLPPELPGSSAAGLEARQIWWLFAVVTSTAGLAAIGFGRNWIVWGAGAALLLLPHLVGAPHPHGLSGVSPPELAAQFAGRALAVGAAAWSILGLTAGYFWNRESK
jgi:cobalt transporter subunit CbtA